MCCYGQEELFQRDPCGQRTLICKEWDRQANRFSSSRRRKSGGKWGKRSGCWNNHWRRERMRLTRDRPCYHSVRPRGVMQTTPKINRATEDTLTCSIIALLGQVGNCFGVFRWAVVLHRAKLNLVVHLVVKKMVNLSGYKQYSARLISARDHGTAELKSCQNQPQ